MGTFTYAAYGSNLHPLRIKANDRCPSAELRDTCVIPGWRLVFRKRSFDGSAKCDAEKTGNQSDELRIAVFNIHESEESALDSVEGLGRGYNKVTIELVLAGETVSAKLYLAQTATLVRDVPYEWYMQMVLLGAQYHAFPASYLRRLTI